MPTPLKQPSNLFDNIAPRYDLVNLVLSGGVVVYWDARFKGALARACAQTPAPAILDLGCGTLRLARGLARHAPDARLFGLDPSRAMLDHGLSRLSPDARQRILAVEGEASALPFPDHSLDCVLSQFVWRNLPSRPQALAEIRRVLKPGGQLLILEFGCGQTPIWGGLYNFYLRRILPRLAALLSPRKKAYDYLVQSILAFPQPETIAEEIRAAGLTNVFQLPLSSGIVFLHAASRGSNA